LDKIIPKNNDEGRAIYGNLENKINTLYWNYAKSKYTHIYIESLVKYVVSVIDYNISLFRTAPRSNYAIIYYTMLQSASIVILRNGLRFSSLRHI
jgi:hypothetical protein